ncbi:MAG: GTP pyrophosphokinase [Myxococcales bacterium]|nr:GTP pyrophosphokinase [Myxococcales bacterium]
MSDLERAIAIAAQAHRGVVDKAGAPYILHPLRVMLAQTTNDARIVGVLHDVVEDSDWTFEALRAEGFSEPVLEALVAVTKTPEEHGSEEGYERFVRRAAAHPIGRAVKLADLEDNADLSRIAAPTVADHARVEKYRRAIAALRDP